MGTNKIGKGNGTTEDTDRPAAQIKNPHRGIEDIENGRPGRNAQALRSGAGVGKHDLDLDISGYHRYHGRAS